ncbi:MAG: histidine kinase [Bacteroidota bacterium]|nr:histidine kinase [Bacteroidota bacterium]
MSVESKKYSRKRNLLIRVILHLIFWIGIVFYFAWGFGFGNNIRLGFLNALLYLPGHMIMTYSLLYFLTPVFLEKKKYVSFFIGLAALLLVCACYVALANLTIEVLPGSYKGASLGTGQNVLPFIHVAAIAFSIKFLGNWNRQRQQTIEAQHAQLKAELELLKSQIHPHFLFNTLNNLYLHTLEQSDHAPEIVLKLSHLLRFMIYESRAPKIPLAKEIALVQSYMELEQLRYGTRLDVSFVYNGNISDHQIAPLLLLPFIENAYKHGTSHQIDQCWISFDLSVEGSRMRFKLINSFDSDEGFGKVSNGGLGLQNARRRLELIYPGKYSLQTRSEDEIFIVDLELELDLILEGALIDEDPFAQSTQLYDLEMPDSR